MDPTASSDEQGIIVAAGNAPDPKQIVYKKKSFLDVIERLSASFHRFARIPVTMCPKKKKKERALKITFQCAQKTFFVEKIGKMNIF